MSSKLAKELPTRSENDRPEQYSKPSVHILVQDFGQKQSNAFYSRSNCYGVAQDVMLVSTITLMVSTLAVLATIWFLTQSLMRADESSFMTGYTVIWLLQGLPRLLDTMFQQLKDWCNGLDELMITRYVDLSIDEKPYEFKALSKLLKEISDISDRLAAQEICFAWKGGYASDTERWFLSKGRSWQLVFRSQR